MELRELDALVAEHVMGQTTDIKELMHRAINDEPGSCGCSREVFDACWADPNWWGHNSYTQERARKQYIPEYSICISDAWRVVERMRELGHCWEFDAGDWGFTADVDPTSDLGGPNSARCESMPLAICIAALKAFGVPTTELEAP